MLVSWERITHSTRRTDVERSALSRAMVPLLGVGLLLCAGCGGGGAQPSGSQIPDVSGQQARTALIHLRQGGYDHFSWAGRFSSQPVGTVLATRPAAGTATPHDARIRLVMSQGPRTRPTQFVMVPGIGTCDVNPLPPGTPCAGGPVMLPIGR
jgi:hypothetical protein